jgi:hypothetical protein
MERVLNFMNHSSGAAFSGWAARGVAVCIAATLAACAAQLETRAIEPKRAEGVVVERAQARWNALLAGKLSEAYQFYSPTSREALSYEDFIRSIRLGFWKSAQVEKAVCESQDACVAEIYIEYSYKGSMIRTPISETWIRKDGTWWYVLRG